MTEIPAPLKPLSDDDRLIPASELPFYIGLKQQTLARKRHEGTGPEYVRLGGRIYYPTAAIRRWIAESGHKSTSTYKGR